MNLDKEYILKVVFAIGLLFVLFLWSGGVYTYSFQNRIWRINKITGDAESLNNFMWICNTKNNYDSSLNIFKDKEFQALSYRRKKRIVSNWVNQNFKDSPKYTKKQIEQNIADKVIDFKISDIPARTMETFK